MQDLQDLCNEVVEEFEKFNFLEHIRGKVGLLEKKQHYKAIFIFRPTKPRKVEAMKAFLENKQYEIKFSFGRHPFTREYWLISLIADEGKPVEQKTALVKSLNLLRDYLTQYKKQK